MGKKAIFPIALLIVSGIMMLVSAGMLLRADQSPSTVGSTNTSIPTEPPASTPTVHSTSTPTGAIVTPAITTSPRLGSNLMEFVSDVTIPDGTLIAPNTAFTKTWRLRNSGANNWESGYRLVFDSGEAMGFAGEQMLPKVIQPGEQFDVTVQLVSPATPGTHTGYFKLADAGGQRFGSGAAADQPFYVQISVTDQGAITFTQSPASSRVIKGKTHLVSKNDTLSEIAAQYRIDIEDIRKANLMVGDAILAGQRLLIPETGQNLTRPPYRFSILEGAIDAAYPLSLLTNRFSLHYSADTYPAQDPQIVSSLVDKAIKNVETIFGKPLPSVFDVYVAGSLFAPPERILRGRSFSRQLRYHFLHDGSGNAVDQQYIAAHELTHLYAWNVFGIPISTMLSEGVAVYSGMNAIKDSNYLPLDTFCAAYLQAGELPRISGSLSYQGHNLDLQNYYAAGSFAGYLIRTYGTEPFARLYSSGDYSGIYQRSLPMLEEDWRQYLASIPISNEIDPARLVSSVKTVTNEYGRFFPVFQGTAVQIAAYRELDKARLALLEGDLDGVASQLDQYQLALTNTP